MRRSTSSRLKGFAFQQRDGSGAVVSSVDLRLAGEPREDLLVDLQDVVLVVEDEDFLTDSHGSI
jgi:hypothetical protein